MYLMKLRDEIGDEEVDSMFSLLAMKNLPIDEDKFIQDLIAQYQIILNTL